MSNLEQLLVLYVNYLKHDMRVGWFSRNKWPGFRRQAEWAHLADDLAGRTKGYQILMRLHNQFQRARQVLYDQRRP